MQLPAGTSYVKARVTPQGGKTQKALFKPMYDAQAHTVTWPDVPLAPGRARMYMVLTKILPTATSPLIYQATCPNSPALSTQSNVTVRV